MRAIFIDGMSLHHLGHAIGVAQFKPPELAQLLIETGGEMELYGGSVFITVSKEMGHKAANLWRNSGYKVHETTTQQSQDDKDIIERIAALDPVVVKEVVLLSTDQDYIHVLREKKQQGMKVTWVGTAISGPQGTPLMSTSLKPSLGTEFDFIDLNDHKDRVMALPKKMMPMRPAAMAPFRIEFGGAAHSVYMEVMKAIIPVLEQHPEMKFKIEG